MTPPDALRHAWAMDASTFRSEETLGDGTRVTFRAAGPGDAPRYRKAFAALDPTSIYTRFFGYRHELSEQELARLDALTFEEEAIIVATVLNEGEEVIVGSGHYVSLGGRPPRRSAELAFVVEEDYQGRGIARRLLGHLATIARAAGFTHFEAEVLAGNRAMLAVFERCGFGMEQRREGTSFHVTLSLPARGP
jgi:GNAT superfamily N-acetyltransferase